MQQRYKDRVTFQIIDVGHQVDGTGWTTTLTAIMRTSPARAVTLTTKKITTVEEVVKIDNQFKKFMEQQLKEDEDDGTPPVKKTEAERKFARK
jgi:hypothetical protein